MAVGEDAIYIGIDDIVQPDYAIDNLLRIHPCDAIVAVLNDIQHRAARAQVKGDVVADLMASEGAFLPEPDHLPVTDGHVRGVALRRARPHQTAPEHMRHILNVRNAESIFQRACHR